MSSKRGRAFVLELHADESGVFHQMGRAEPFVIALLYRDNGQPGREVAEAWWNRLDLGHYSHFHATEVRDKQRLVHAVDTMVDHFRKTPEFGTKVVYYQSHPGQPLPRSDVHLDLLLHAVVVATRARVRNFVQHADPKARRKTLVVRLNIARRNPVNALHLEKVAARAIREDLERFELTKEPGEDGAGLRAGQVRCEISVLPAASSVLLTISDLLCNHWYRSLKRGHRPGWPRSWVWEVPRKRLGALMSDEDFALLGGQFPLSAEPTSPQTAVQNLLSTQAPPWSAADLGIDPAGIPAAERVGILHFILTTGEHDARDERRSRACARLAAELLADPAWSGDIDPIQRDIVDIAVDSLEVSLANRLGRPAAPELFDLSQLGRSQRAIIDPASWDTVVRYHNRAAVSMMHSFAFREADARVDQVLEWFRDATALSAGPFGSAPTVNNYALGALLGTHGQARALLGSATGDPELLADADEAFVEAMDHFVTLGDLDRQQNYRAHVALERIKLELTTGSEAPYKLLFEEYAASTEASLRAFSSTVQTKAHWRHAYRIAVLLKLAFLTGQGQDQVASIAEATAPLMQGRLRHPWEQIAGYLAQLLGSSCKAAVRDALDATAGGDGVTALVARAHLLQLDGGSAEHLLDSLHPTLRENWDALGLSDRLRDLQAQGEPLLVLPFYYL